MVKIYLILIASFFLVSCEKIEKYPDSYGIYLINNAKSDSEKFLALRTADSFTRITQNIETTPSILFFNRRIANNPSAVKIYSGIYIRKIRKNDSWKGNLPVETINTWHLAKERTTIVAGTFSPVKNQPDMVLWRPQTELLPGVYFIEIEHDKVEPFFYKKTQAISNIENSNLCFDYYQYFMSPDNRFFPCRENHTEDDKPAPIANASKLSGPPKAVKLEEPFVVKLRGSDHYLQTKIVLTTENKFGEEIINKSTKDIRKKILLILASKTSDQLSKDSEIDVLQKEIQVQVNLMLGDQTIIKEVYFPNFLIQ